MRISFHHLPGWYEGPCDVLWWSYRKLGDARAAEEAEQGFRRALELRIAEHGHAGGDVAAR